MEEVSVESIIDATTINSVVGATPLEIEKAKVKALNRQLSRALDDKSKLRSMLEHAHSDLERQIQETLRLQKILAKAKTRDAMEKVVRTVSPNDDVVRELKVELASVQKNLADEIFMAKKKDERMQTLQDQCTKYKEEFESLKQGECDNEKRVAFLNLQKQRSELLVVIKKQMKLIDILKQQRAHVEATALLNIAERDFIKEVNIGKPIVVSGDKVDAY